MTDAAVRPTTETMFAAMRECADEKCLKPGVAPRQTEYRNWQDVSGRRDRPTVAEIIRQFGTWVIFADAASFDRMGRIDLAEQRERIEAKAAQQQLAIAVQAQQEDERKAEAKRLLEAKAQQGEAVWFEVPITMTVKTTMVVQATSAEEAADMCRYENLTSDDLHDMAGNPASYVVHTEDIAFTEYQ